MINKVILVGNVGKNPEVKHFENDNVVANFPFATSETYKDKQGEKITRTEWHRIVCWNALGKLAENYIKKGTQLYIEGKIRTRNYDIEDGSKRYITEIFADTIRFLGKKSDNTNTSAKQEPESDVANKTPIDTKKDADDLPF